MKTKQPNLRGLAAEAGVSLATVSRILNRGEGHLFAQETTRRVMATAERLGYRPNLLMRGVLTGKTRTIGVMAPNNSAFYSGVIAGIHDTLAEQNYALLLSWNKEDTPSPDSDLERALIHRMIDRRVDGIILRPTHDNVSDMYFSEVWERNIPLVAVDRELVRVHCDFAGTDDKLGGQLAAQHLLDLGHRRLGHLAPPRDVSTARDRREGFEQAILRAGNGAYCLVLETKGFHKVYPEAMELLAQTPRVTAVFCPSDEAAQEFYRAATDSGLRIPQDISVIGFADLPVASFLHPRLTTLRQNPERIGCQAANLLLARIEGRMTGEEVRKERLAPELIVRDSTAPPA